MPLRSRASLVAVVVLLALALAPAPSLARRAVPAPAAASVPASGALSAELRARLARIPDEGTPDPGEHYPVSNEWRHDLWLPAIRDLGGIFVGVGPDQCYTLAAMQNASLALLVDFDPMVPLVHRMYAVLVPASDTPDALVARFRTRTRVRRARSSSRASRTIPSATRSSATSIATARAGRATCAPCSGRCATACRAAGSRTRRSTRGFARCSRTAASSRATAT
jgi:hypothetical protein